MIGFPLEIQRTNHGINHLFDVCVFARRYICAVFWFAVAAIIQTSHRANGTGPFNPEHGRAL
jgi:hypothetical protein